MLYKAKKGKIRILPIAEHMVQSNLQEIEKESWEEWANKPPKEFKVIPPLPSTAWKQTPLRTFLSQITP